MFLNTKNLLLTESLAACQAQLDAMSQDILRVQGEGLAGQERERTLRETLMALVHYVQHATVKGTPLSLEELGLDGENECPSLCDMVDLTARDEILWNHVRAALAPPAPRP